MRGNSLQEFMDDLLTMGGPEKEFVFRGQKYFLETVFDQDREENELYITSTNLVEPKTFSFFGKTFSECVSQFESAPIFDGLTIYEAESEIEVLFG